MGDLEILQKYEPVLRYAPSERFFPMDVERYLEQCRVFPSGPQGAVGLIALLNEQLNSGIGKLNSHQYFLRFVNNPFSAADAWIVWSILSITALGAGWYFKGQTGIEIAALLSLTAALIIFMQASPIRLRIIPAVFATLFFCTLEIIPIAFFLNPNTLVNAQIEYYLLLPLYLLILAYLSIRTMKYIFDHVIPEGPGVIMDMLSHATERVAREAFHQYGRILEKDDQPIYYGRVVNEQDANKDHWKILQYHFFYAFNDWRLAANGLNHHEGDWEMVAVYLKNDQPYAVLYSQHGAGAMELWADVLKVQDANGDTDHPIVYVALGSHANYSKPEVVRSPELYRAGFVKRFLYWMDGAIRFIFLLVNPDQKARQIALNELTGHTYLSILEAEDRLLRLRDEADHYLISLPVEIPTGEGFRIGVEGNIMKEVIGHSTSYLRRIMSNRKVMRPGTGTWRPVLLTAGHEWIEYKGLWGVKSLLENESGPPGPKWDRPYKGQPPKPRVRWARPLEWLAELEEREQKKKISG